MFRECGDCNRCCSGMLIGSSYGNEFGLGKQCVFLVSGKCTIYDTRPESCVKYQCAWSQNLLKEDSRPDKCDVLVSVEGKETQYLKAIYNNENLDVESELNEFGKLHNCEIIHVRVK